MSDIKHAIEDFPSITQSLIGLPVSLPWKGYGSALFLELGRLSSVESPRYYPNEGESNIWIEWDWRIERGSRVLFGSSNSGMEIEEGIGVLQGRTIESMALFGDVSELIINFSCGLCLRSMVMRTGYPQWHIKLRDKTYIYKKNNSLFVGVGESEGLTDQEKFEHEIAERTVVRWGIPTFEPRLGHCRNCDWFLRLGAHNNYSKYGVCIANNGPLDGRIVNVESGCPAFCMDEEP